MTLLSKLVQAQLASPRVSLSNSLQVSLQVNRQVSLVDNLRINLKSTRHPMSQPSTYEQPSSQTTRQPFHDQPSGQRTAELQIL